MASILNRKRISAACICIAFAGASARIIPAFAADSSSKETMMTEQLDKIKDETKDDSKKTKMTEELSKMMVEHKMAMSMVSDSKCEAMLSGDAETMKMMTDAKAMAMDPEKMKSMKEEIEKDPHAMKVVMMMDMVMTEMMKDKVGTDKTGSMDKSSMEGMKEKMEDKMK